MGGPKQCLLRTEFFLHGFLSCQNQADSVISVPLAKSDEVLSSFYFNLIYPDFIIFFYLYFFRNVPAGPGCKNTPTVFASEFRHRAPVAGRLRFTPSVVIL